jgi:hypothetical protein
MPFGIKFLIEQLSSIFHKRFENTRAERENEEAENEG